MTQDERTQVAKTIIEQLGGRRFQTMTGAKHFVALEEPGGLQFSLPVNFARNGANKVQIRLTPLDLYVMIFYNTTGREGREVQRFEDIYCDQLRDLFEEATGLATSL